MSEKLYDRYASFIDLWLSLNKTLTSFFFYNKVETRLNLSPITVHLESKKAQMFCLLYVYERLVSIQNFFQIETNFNW